jgi:hypothetical protein
MGRGTVAAGLVASSVALVAPMTMTATAGAATTDLVAVNRARDVGLRAVDTQTYAASPVDYNRDGRQDVWIGYHGFGGKLWRNRAGRRYERVAKTAWPRSNGRRHVDRHDCAWADVDRNGLPDAYCSTGRMIPNFVKTGRDNELWLQRSPGRFVEVGTRWGVGDQCGRGRAVTFLDVNGDRFPDLFVGNETPRDDPDDPCNAAGNRLPNEAGKVFVNVRGTHFRYARDLWNFGAGVGVRCARVLDVDRDGWDDLLTCGEPRTPLRLYRNRSGHGFADVTAQHQLGASVSDAVAADLDRDGDKDVVTATPLGWDLHRNIAGVLGPAEPVGAVTVGEGWSVAVGDADGDGDSDVYGMVFASMTDNPADRIWINNGGTVFDPAPVPVPPAAGAADTVVALTPRLGRRVGFVVLNGFGRLERGPVQFIQVFRR